MNKKSLFLPFLCLIVTFTGYSQCEGVPNIPDYVNPVSNDCAVFPPETGQFAYDLTQSYFQITNNNQDYVLTYHLTQVDADNGTNPIDFDINDPEKFHYIPDFNDPYNNPENFEIYARVVDTPSGCVGTVVFNCTAFGYDVVNYVSPLLACDDNGDGYVDTFDLESKTQEILSAYSNDPLYPMMVVTYHLTSDDAINNINQLTSPYANQTINNQMVYARVTKDEAMPQSCYKIHNLELDVSSCDNLGRIKVNAYLDTNGNGVKDLGEKPFIFGRLAYTKSGGATIYSRSQTGTHIIYSDSASNSYNLTYNISSQYSGYYTATNTTHQSIQVIVGDILNIDIPVQVQQAYNDLEVSLVPTLTPRPGFDYYNKVVITNNGSSSISAGSVSFQLHTNSQYSALENASSGVTAVDNGNNNISINYPSIAPGASIYALLRLYSSPSVPLGTLIVNYVSAPLLPNEINNSNNSATLTEVVIGSYDPNDIMESHGPDIIFEEFTSQDYLHYTIRFQNVGTAEAIHVRIEDEIDPLLDVSTLEIVGSSHGAQLIQDGNSLTWKHDFINLPAEQDNEPESHGYVQYKIKPTVGYAVGTIIPNKADIYFDFNAPVITNTFNTEFHAQCENNPVLPEFLSQAQGCYMYPNMFEYNFLDQEQQVVNGNTNYAVTFHLSQEDADNNANNIFSTHIVPMSMSNFMVYVRVEDSVSGCANSISFECMPGLEVFANTPTPLEVCDDDNDGYESFDLTSKDSQISGGNPDYTVTYHENESDAMDNMSPLVAPYTNTQPNSQVIYARVKNTMGAPTCSLNTNYTIVQLTLEAKECLSVNTLEAVGFSMYPNPVSDKLTITSTYFSEARLTLTTIQGKELMSRSLNFSNQKAILNVSKLPRGVYFARLQSATNSVVKKLIIE